MTVTEDSIERPAPPAVRAGDLAARYKFTGSVDSGRFDVDVVIGELGEGEPEYVDEFAAYAVVVKSGARVVLPREYERPALDLTDAVRRGISFTYAQQMLLRGHADSAEGIQLAVDQLVDNKALTEAGLAWQASVVGFSNIRVMQRALYVARNATEMDQPFSTKTPSDPEIRVDMLSFLGGKAFDAFLAMPPIQRSAR